MCDAELREDLADFDAALAVIFELNGERSRLPVLRSVFRLPAGMGLPLYLSSIGLGSKVSTCDGPPFRNRKMTCFALAGKWGALGASGSA